jgi:phosphatidylglycerol:prolipoprotein diacylglycerol transferase
VENALDVIRLNEGGISIYGAMIGGLLGGMLYVALRRLPMLRGLDVAIVGLLTGMAIGRIGDLINGEHFAKVSDLPWAIRYTNLNSPSVLGHPECGLTPVSGIDTSALCAQHPAVGYEMLGDLLIVGIAFLIFRFVRRDGFAFFSCLLLYAVMRFGVSELRIDSETVFAGLTTPQVTSLCLVPIALAGLAWTWFRGRSNEAAQPPPQRPLSQPEAQPAR